MRGLDTKDAAAPLARGEAGCAKRVSGTEGRRTEPAIDGCCWELGEGTCGLIGGDAVRGRLVGDGLIWWKRRIATADASNSLGEATLSVAV